MSAGRLLRVVAPHFVAGVIVDGRGRVIEAAPILRYALGWTGLELRTYAASKRWAAAYVDGAPAAPR